MKTKTITLVAIAAVGAVIAGYIYFSADICGNGFGRKVELFKPDFWTGEAVRF